MIEKFLKQLQKEIPYIKAFEEEDDTWCEEGYDFLEKREFLRAEKKFKELIPAQPEHHDGYEGLAAVYYTQGKVQEAIMLMEEAVKIARSFLEDDSIDIEVIEEMEDNLKRMKEAKPLNRWWKRIL